MKTIYLLKRTIKVTILIALMLFSHNTSAQNEVIETTVYHDDYSGDNLSGGTPATTFTFLKQTISGSEPNDALHNNEMMRVTAPANSVTRNGVFGDLSVYSAPFKSKLSDIEADSVVWTFNLRSNRTYTTGFDDEEYGIATILLTDAADYSTANGYAVVNYNKNSSTTRSFRLVKFTGGLDANAKFTDLVDGVAGQPTLRPSFRVTYIKNSNTWKFYSRDDGATFGVDPAQGEFSNVGEATDDSFVNTPMTHFGYYISCKSFSGATNLEADNFTVRTYATDVLNSNKNVKSNTNLFNTRLHPGVIEIEVSAAKATLFDVTGKLLHTATITNKGVINVDNKGLYILKVDLPDGRSGLEKIIIR